MSGRGKGGKGLGKEIDLANPIYIQPATTPVYPDRLGLGHYSTDMECQSGEDNGSVGSGSEDNGQGHPAIVNVSPPAAMPDELDMLIRIYMNKEDHQFSWKIQGGAGQTSVTLIFRKNTEKTGRAKNKSRANKKRDLERSKKSPESQLETKETQTPEIEIETQMKPKRNITTCDIGTQYNYIKTRAERWQRDRSDSRKRKTVGDMPNTVEAEEATAEAEEATAEETTETPEMEMYASPDKGEKTIAYHILRNKQEATLWEKNDSESGLAGRWEQKSEPADLYICNDRKHTDRKWCLLLDRETRKRHFEEKADSKRTVVTNDTGIVYWRRGERKSVGIKCKDQTQTRLLKKFMRGENVQVAQRKKDKSEK